MALIGQVPEGPITDGTGNVTPGWKPFFSSLQSLVSATTISGTTANRPTNMLWAGRQYFDTSLGTNGKPMWLASVSGGVATWVDALGGSGGILPVTLGGTGLSSGTSGGILGFTGTTTLASSALLTANALVLGGGAGVTPSTPVGLGTTTTVLHGNVAGAPTWGQVSLAADVSGTLPENYGGTGQSSYTIGDLLYASGAATLAKLPDVATGNALISGGVGAAPSWGKVGLTTHVTGTLTVGNGGTGIASGTSGGVLGFTGATTIASSAALTANALVLGGGAGATPSTPVGLGTTTTLLHGNAAGAPTWGAVSLTADVTGTLTIGNGGTNSATALSGNTIMISNGTAIVQGAAGTTTTVLHGNASGSPTYSAVSLTADVSGQLPLANGGTAANLTASNGGIFYSTSTAGAILAGTATAGQIVRSGASAAPSWSTATYPSTAGTAANVLRSDGTNFLSAALATNDLSASATNDSATAGHLGEYVDSSVTGVTINTASAGNVTTISLTAGDWDVAASIASSNWGTNSYWRLGISQTSATFTGAEGKDWVYQSDNTSISVGSGHCPELRISLSGTTTIYLVAQMGVANNSNVSGYLRARRAR